MALKLDTTPYWMDSAPLPAFRRLEHDRHVDVVIVGAGISGLTSAYLLARAGRSVAVVERGQCAAIDTGHTSAHVTMVTDSPLSDLVRSFGRDHAQAVWDAGLAAIAQIDSIVRDERIDCDFAWVPAYLHAAQGARAADVQWLQDEAALAADLGFDASFDNEVPLVGVAGVRFENQARFHPRKYLAGLARAIVERGGHVYEHSAAEEFSSQPLFVKANGRKLSCDYVVLATHTPLVGNDSMPSATLFQTKLTLYTTYVVAGRVRKGKAPDALLWDTHDPYHYLRIDPRRDHDLVIYGGEDHKTGQADDTADCYERLERKVAALIPGIDITHRWSGQVVETPDGLPYIGETADRQFASTGFAGNGMTFGTLAAMMACDRMLGRSNPWSDLLEPDRRKIRGAAWDYIKENKDYPYYLIRDRFAGAEGRSLRAVKRGEGKIVEHKRQQTAVYRDESGKATLLSAVCTHMGCLVDWNEAERTWDCPCHGSRFQTDGKVIAGPAESPLEKIE